jgi:hypothetical protein
MGEEKNIKADKAELPLGKDFSGPVMANIKRRHVKIRRAYIFFLERLGLESALVASLIFAAIIISITFRFFDESEILKFLRLGMPGLKVIFLTLPYDYLALFVIMLALAIYLARKLDIPCRRNVSCCRIFAYFFIASFFVGAFFILVGVNEAVKGWSKNKIPRQMSVHGKIMEITPDGVVIEDKEGERTDLVFNKKEDAPSKTKYQEGKFMRAVGSRDRYEENIFHVDSALCCEDR